MYIAPVYIICVICISKPVKHEVFSNQQRVVSACFFGKELPNTDVAAAGVKKGVETLASHHDSTIWGQSKSMPISEVEVVSCDIPPDVFHCFFGTFKLVGLVTRTMFMFVGCLLE